MYSWKQPLRSNSKHNFGEFYIDVNMSVTYFLKIFHDPNIRIKLYLYVLINNCNPRISSNLKDYYIFKSVLNINLNRKMKEYFDRNMMNLITWTPTKFIIIILKWVERS
jgi:hypothetical protein